MTFSEGILDKNAYWTAADPVESAFKCSETGSLACSLMRVSQSVAEDRRRAEIHAQTIVKNKDTSHAVQFHTESHTSVLLCVVTNTMIHQKSTEIHSEATVD